jgi:dienelactone hydrolase
MSGSRRGAVALCAVFVLAGCGGGSHHVSQPPPPFAYDASRPLGLRERGRVNAKTYPIAIRDVSYAVPGGRVSGYLAVPPRGRRLAAVLYLHGSGGTRAELIVPAAWLAGRRAVALTITLPSSVAGAPAARLGPVQQLARQRRLAVQDVVAVRRAVDLLRSLPQVDPSRIGLVGWSFGARVGAIVAGVEPRIRAFVLMSGGSVPVSAYVAEVPAALRAQVRRTLTQIDPLRWIAHARPGTILLQDGRKDTVVPRAALLALAHAAPKGTELRWYAAPHELNDRAYRDQLAWLSRKLGIHGPPVAGARTGP